MKPGALTESELCRLIENFNADILWQLGFPASLKPLASMGCPLPLESGDGLYWPGLGWADCTPTDGLYLNEPDRASVTLFDDESPF